jgi:hypothetical protein
MRRTLTLAALFVAAAAGAAAGPLTVHCERGQSLNAALAKLAALNEIVPITVNVTGTCTEYVKIRGFQGLTLRGLSGATIVQPGVPPAAGLLDGVLTIEASRSVTIDGVEIYAPSSSAFGIFIRSGSDDVRLRNVTVEGGSAGILIAEHSQVSLARVTARDPVGWTTLGIYDMSDVHVEDCVFEHSTGEGWHDGIDVGKALLTLHGTTIRNMQEGIVTRMGGIVDVSDFNGYSPLGGSVDVVIENPAGTNFHGLLVGEGGTVTLSFAKLRITNAGQSWGGDTGGVLVQDRGVLSAGPYLEVSGSQGQGVVIRDKSHAILGGSRVSGSWHNGLVVVNDSSVAVGLPDSPATEISGSAAYPGGSAAKDVFCDSRSLITGGSNLSASTVQCDNLMMEGSVEFPW